MAGGAFAVHQARYVLAYGHGSSHRLADQGHAYLTPLLGIAALVLALGAGAYLLRLARGRAPARTGPPRSLARSWLASSAGLVALYSLQEGLEGLLEPAHPAGVAGVFGGGGWLALPLSLLIGLAIALALRGADSAPELVPRPLTRPRRVALVGFHRPRGIVPAPRDAVARHLAGRGPPLASV